MVKSSTELSSTPQIAPFEQDYPLPNYPAKPSLWKRLAIGGVCLASGLCVAAVGATSVSYRLTHMTIDGGLISGRTVRVQAPADGTIQDFYARPGVEVQSGQVLARLDLAPQDQTATQTSAMQLQQNVQARAAELTTARQKLALLQQQLLDLQSQDQQLQAANVSMASEDVDRHEAALNAAIAQEAAARSEYERYVQLLNDGAVSQNQVDELEADWKAAQAAVAEMEATRNSAEVMLQAVNQSVPVRSSVDDLQEQQRQLQQDIQVQETQIKQIELALQGSQMQLDQLQALQSERRETLDVAAPFTGVVYVTEHDAGEQVNRSAALLTLLDCNDLWVETIVSVEQANRINPDQPVRVQLSGNDSTLNGEVELIAAMSSGELTKARTEALIPAVSPNLLGQPLARVRVKIPSVPQQAQSHRFCGVGQTAQLTFSTRMFAGNNWL